MIVSMHIRHWVVLNMNFLYDSIYNENGIAFTTNALGMMNLLIILKWKTNKILFFAIFIYIHVYITHSNGFIIYVCSQYLFELHLPYMKNLHIDSRLLISKAQCCDVRISKDSSFVTCNLSGRLISYLSGQLTKWSFNAFVSYY